MKDMTQEVFKEFEKEVLAMRPGDLIPLKMHCSQCGANPKMELDELFECYKGCTNCKADLVGGWRGIFPTILQFKILQHGLETVKLSYDKFRFERV